MAYAEGPKLMSEWFALWDWGGLDPEQASGGAQILWDQVVEDVKEFGRPFFGIYEDDGPTIAVGILGEGECHIVIPISEIEIIDEKERQDIAAALFALAFKIATSKGH